MYTLIKILCLYFIIGYCNYVVHCQDQTVYTGVSSPASLPCGSISKPFPDDASTVYWYTGTDVTNTLARILIFGESIYGHYNGYSSTKYTCSPDRTLTIADIENGDGGYYTCESFEVAWSYSVELIIVSFVSPSQPTLTNLAFDINSRSSLQCRVESVYPGVGSVMFTLTVDPDIQIQSSDSDLSEGSADPTTGAVSVTYSPQISLQRKHNGQQAVCVVVWRGEPVTSEGRTVDVRFLATSILMTQSPSGVVPSGVRITFNCLTDEANPPASVTWTVDGSSRSSTSDSTIDDGVFNALKRQSVLTLTADKGLHGKNVKCIVGGIIGAADEKILDVGYSPSVSLQSSSAITEEGSLLIISCGIQMGNPEEVTSQYWDFEPKYTGSQSQALPEQNQNRELRIESTVYTDAGTYRCTAGNKVGSDTGETQIVVYYSPKFLGDDKELVFYSGLHQNVTLHLTVHALPEPTDLNSAFDWAKLNINSVGVYSSTRINEAETFKINEEVYQSFLLIHSVVAENFGNYTVTVNNGVRGPVTFQLQLRLGPPEAPIHVTVTAVAAEQAIVSWVVGLGGASQQSFKIVIIEMESGKHIVLNTSFINPTVGSLLRYNVKNLKPETTYQLTVNSINQYNQGSETPSSRVLFTTRAKPVVSQKDLTVLITGGSAKLSWVYKVYNLAHTSVIIEQCNETENCIEHNVTGNTEQTLEVLVSHGTIFFFVIYQDGLEAYRSEQFIEVSSEEIDTPDETTEANLPLGGILGGLGACAIVSVIVAITIWYFRKKGHMQKRSTEAGTSEAPVYMNTLNLVSDNYEALQQISAPEKKLYQELGTKGSAETDFCVTASNPSNENYQDLIAKEEDVKVVYQDLVSQHYKETCNNKPLDNCTDETLFLGEILHKGHYSITRKAIMKTEERDVMVAVKSLIGLSGTQYLVNQIRCFSKTGQHPCVVETILYQPKDPTDIKLVTVFYQNGSLKKILQEVSNLPSNCKRDNFFVQLVLDIVSGLAYLDTITPEILHFCLSSEHILVDDTGSCRLTGFEFKEHVLQREMDEEEEGIYGAIEWKAPEIIEDCKAHTKTSDVWAFGILVYEIYTKAKRPYEGMIEEDIKAFVRSGEILPRPVECLHVMYTIMKNCWAYDAQKRPKFRTLLSEIQQIQDDLSET